MATVNIDLTGVTSGSQYASAGNNTIYTNLPFNTAGTTATNVTFFVGASSSIDILYNQNFRVDTTAGLHELFGNIEVQGASSEYTVSSWYGKVTLTHKTSGQVISFQLTKPLQGPPANNSGVNVEFLDGAIAFTSNVNGQGVWSVWATTGGSDTSTWGQGGLAAQVPGTYTPGAAPLDLSDAADTGFLNYSVNSSGVTDWTGTSYGATYTLTTGIDTFTGTTLDDIFNASLSAGSNTLQNFDSLNGNGGTDTLNAQLSDSSVSPVALQNIELLNVSSQGSKGSTIDLVTAAQASVVTNLASTDDLTINNIVAGADLAVTNTNQDTTFNYQSTSGFNSADLIVQQASGKISVAGIEQLNITSNGVVTNAVQLDNTSQTTLTATGGTNLTVTGIGNVTSINASTMTGGLTATLTQVGTVIGGEGNDTLQLTNGGSLVGGDGNDVLGKNGGSTGNITIDAGEGDDTVYGSGTGNSEINLGNGENFFYAFNAATSVLGGEDDDLIAFDGNSIATATIDGGAGINTLRLDVSNAQTNSVTALTNVNNIQTLELNAGNVAGTINLGNIDSTINQVINRAAVNNGKIIVNDGATTISQSVANTGTLTLEDSGSSTKEAVTIANTDLTTVNVIDGKAITTVGIETLSINTGSKLTVAQTVGTITINGEAVSTPVSFNASGANSLSVASINSSATALLSVDLSGLTAQASGATGSISAIATAGTVSVTGSGGNDLLTGDADGSNTILGAGGADTISGSSVGDSLDGGIGNDSITGAGGNDTVIAGEGDDTVTTGAGNDSIVGDAGNDSITSGAGNDTITGGTGDDIITVTGVGTVSIDGGANNDIVNVGNTLSIGDSINGGAGVNVLQQSTALLQNFSGAQNFQTLQLDAAMTQNLAKFTANTTWEQINATTGINAITNAAGTVQTIALDNSVDEFSLSRISGQTGSVVVQALQDEATSIAALTLNNETIVEFEAGSITKAANLLKVDALNAVAVDALTITGLQNTSITVGASSSTTGLGTTARTVTLDATAATGTVVWDGSSAAAQVAQALYGSKTAASSLTGGDGNDVITIGNVATGNFVAGGNGNNSITGGTGADSISAGTGNDTINSGEGEDSINGGAGNNAITAGDGDVNVVTSTGIDTITVGDGDVVITSGAGADTITAGDGANTVNAGAGTDVITIGIGGNKITAGSDADSLTLTTGGASDRVIQGTADGVAPTATTLSATVTAGNTLTFDNNLDIVENFKASGTGFDTLGVAVDNEAPLSLIGVDPTAMLINKNYYLSGSYNELLGVFTATADGSGPDTLIVQGGGGQSLATNTSILLLQGVNSADLSANNFVAPLSLQAIYRADNQYLVGGPADAALTIAAATGNVTGVSAVDYIGTYSQANVTKIDASYVDFTGGTKGATINVDGNVSTKLASVTGTSENDTIIQAVANFGAANSTVSGGSAGTDALQFQTVNTALTLEDVSKTTGAQITGIEVVQLNLTANATQALTLGTSLTTKLAVENKVTGKAAIVDLGTGAAHTYESTATTGDTVTLGLTGQTATFNNDTTSFIENAVAGSSVVTKGAGTNQLTLNNINAFKANYTGNGTADSLVLKNGLTGTVTTGTLTGIDTVNAGTAGIGGVDVTLSSAVATLAGDTSSDTVTFQSSWASIGQLKSIAVNNGGSNDFSIKTTAGSETGTLDISTIGLTGTGGNVNVNNWDFSKTTGSGLKVTATNAQVVGSKSFIGTADTNDTLVFSDGFTDTTTSSIAGVTGFGTIQLANASTTLVVEQSQIGLNFTGNSPAVQNIVALKNGATGTVTTGVMTKVGFDLGQAGGAGLTVQLESTSNVNGFRTNTKDGNVTLQLSTKQLDATTTAYADDGTKTFTIATTATAGGTVDLTDLTSYKNLDVLDFSATTGALGVTATAALVGDIPTFTGSTTVTNDNLKLSTVALNSTLDGVTGFGALLLDAASGTNAIVTKDTLVASGDTLTVTVTNNTGSAGLNFNGSAETDGKFAVTGGLNGNNTLVGGAGADTLTGGDFADTLNGGAGIDSLTGGGGSGLDLDRFVYNQAGFTSADADIITDFRVVAAAPGGDVFNVNGAVAGGIVASLTAAVVNIAGAADNSFIVDSANTGYASFAAAEAAVEAANAATTDYVLIFRNTTTGLVEAWADADSSAVGGGVKLVGSFDTGSATIFLSSFDSSNVSVA